MQKTIVDSFDFLRTYCESNGYKGWDPYDGLNSRLFNALSFFRHSAICRLIVIQTFKRSPLNLRRFLFVPREYNAKGIGLFLNGYCNLYRMVRKDSSNEGLFGTPEELEQKINFLAELLISMQSSGYSGACWGYNFDWQARRLFLFPKNTPTVVATTFCATALMEAYEVTRKKKYLDVALSAAGFIMNDLHRTVCGSGFLFSYSPLPGNDTVFNASLLGSKLLSYCYHYTQRKEYADAARCSVAACCEAQAEDGSWVYGMLPVQSWIDSFHTGYNLDSLIAYQEMTGDISFKENINKGFEFYISHFFENDGSPKYYHNRQYPIDIHCPGQLLVTLSRLNKYEGHRELAEKVLLWTIKNMQSPKGYFYYQLKKGISSKIPYMRWSNAFMFNAVSFYLLESE